MRLKTLISLFSIILILSCKASKDVKEVKNITEDRPANGKIASNAKDQINRKEGISKGACRVAGVISNNSSKSTSSVILNVTAFLGEGASFQTYRPRPGDQVEIMGLKSNGFNAGDSLKVEIQTLPKKSTVSIQKVGFIKNLDL